MFSRVFIPYRGYWSSPFSRWQMSFQNEHPIKLLAETTKKFLELRSINVNDFDGCVFGMTIGMPSWFYANPWYCALIGNDRISGPIISQACSTSATCIYTAACNIETNTYENIIVATTDRCSNGPHSIWPNPNGPGGEVKHENWLMDNFNKDPYAKQPMFMTAELVAKDVGGISKNESDELAYKRYIQYTDSTNNDREFQKGYMIPIDIAISKKKKITINTDEGINEYTLENLKKLKPIIESGVLTFGAQTHPADGNSGIIVTSKEMSNKISNNSTINIQIMSYGYSRANKARMAAAVTPAAQLALKNANICVDDLKAVKTHNPFTINDIVMGRLMNIPDNIFNNYGSPLIFGHPQGPTGARCIVELIEELVKIGGGYGLFAGCAAGDTASALVIKVY